MVGLDWFATTMASLRVLFVLLFHSLATHALYVPWGGASLTASPSLNDTEAWLRERQLNDAAIETELLTCGYRDGDPKKDWPAPAGHNCRIDTKNGLWGFCPTSVIAATDCGLAGACVDKADCSDVCGAPASLSLTTFTW